MLNPKHRTKRPDVENARQQLGDIINNQTIKKQDY